MLLHTGQQTFCWLQVHLVLDCYFKILFGTESQRQPRKYLKLHGFLCQVTLVPTMRLTHLPQSECLKQPPHLPDVYCLVFPVGVEKKL